LAGISTVRGENQSLKSGSPGARAWSWSRARGAWGGGCAERRGRL